MDIDIAFWIVVAVALTGFIYFLDILVLKPKRDKSVENYRSQCATEPNETLILNLQKEPVWVEYPKSFFSGFIRCFGVSFFFD